MLERWAGLWTIGASGLVNLTTTPVLLNSWENAVDGPGCDANVSGGQITIKVPGFYVAYASITFTATAGDTIYFEFYLNGVQNIVRFRNHAEGIASGGAVNVAILGGANMKIGDVVQIYMYSDNAGGTNFVHVDGQFGLITL